MTDRNGLLSLQGRIDMDGPLTPLYGPWIKSLLSNDLPVESKATCAQCAMCPQGDEPFAGFSFNPNTKCCSYHPKLPNYLIGGLLTDDNPGVASGRAKVRAAIASGQASPFGLGPSDDYSVRYERHEFGRNNEMLCPYYISETGYCGVWHNRPATCQTWFCKSDRGEVGNNLWLALNDLLNKIEAVLADWCLLQMDLPLKRHTPLPGHKIDTSKHPEYDWGKWKQDKEGFYIRCFELVSALDWQGVLSACGASVGLLAKRVTLAFKAHQDHSLPKQLYPGSYQLNNLTAEHVDLTTYSPYDPIQLPMPMFQLLHYFNGGSFEEIQARIADEEELEIPPELVRMLLDFGILVDAPTVK